ncbi:zinc-binding dehydrogenase [Streptomyces sp. NPDC059752]|uniref:zinc-binding dehydrogenase n=1 Tax=unclassified Streptomyces TaxID=2593676 RepID=UPI003660AEB4
MECGAGPVVASDPSALRRAAAARLGAHAVVDPSGGEDPVALCAELAGARARPTVVVNCVGLPGLPGLLNRRLDTVPRDTEILQIGGVMTEGVIDPAALIRPGLAGPGINAV